MSAADHYQAIVIGSGQGGTPLCRALAEAGMRTALIEREHIGGTCINEGCTPTKTMVASARVAYLSRRGANYGVHTGDIRIDMQRVRQRKRDIVDSFRNGKDDHVAPKKVSGGDTINGPIDWAGVSDPFFAAIFLPDNPDTATVATLHNQLDVAKTIRRTGIGSGSPAKGSIEVPILGAAAGDRWQDQHRLSAAQRVRRLYSRPVRAAHQGAGGAPRAAPTAGSGLHPDR